MRSARCSPRPRVCAGYATRVPPRAAPMPTAWHGRRRGRRLDLRHRAQAVTLADYEALAGQASSAVAVAHALEGVGPDGGAAPGWVTVVVVPHSGAGDPAPRPTPDLCDTVLSYLLARMPAAADGRVSVTAPRYVPVGAAGTLAVAVGLPRLDRPGARRRPEPSRGVPAPGYRRAGRARLALRPRRARLRCGVPPRGGAWRRLRGGAAPAPRRRAAARHGARAGAPHRGRRSPAAAAEAR